MENGLAAGQVWRPTSGSQAYSCSSAPPHNFPWYALQVVREYSKFSSTPRYMVYR